jgi:hypothetical protein
MKNYVYWIFNESCIRPEDSGYVGVTKNPNIRFKTHLRNKRIPDNSQQKILFEGSREDCFLLEKNLRPQKNIGWNNATGGSHGWRYGFSHSDHVKQKMKDAWTKERRDKASVFRLHQNKKLIGQKRPKQSEKMTGNNNPMFGTKRPEYVKEAVRKAHTGKQPINKQENYCVGCHERSNMTHLKKYHNKCFKLFCEKVK